MSDFLPLVHNAVQSIPITVEGINLSAKSVIARLHLYSGAVDFNNNAVELNSDNVDEIDMSGAANGKILLLITKPISIKWELNTQLVLTFYIFNPDMSIYARGSCAVKSVV